MSELPSARRLSEVTESLIFKEQPVSLLTESTGVSRTQKKIRKESSPLFKTQSLRKSEIIENVPLLPQSSQVETLKSI